MNKLLISLAAIFGVLPGVLTIQNGLGTPEEYRLLFGGVVEAIGVLILILLYNNREGLRKWATKKLRRYTYFAVTGFIISLISYIWIISLVNIKHESRGTYTFPLIVNGELASDIETFGSRKAVIEEWGEEEVREMLLLQPESSFIYTEIILLLIFVLVFSCLTFGFGLNGFYKNDL